MREGLKQLLSTVDELTVSGEAADAEAVHQLLNENSADLLILDLGMPGVSGFQFIAQLRTAWPELRAHRQCRATFRSGSLFRGRQWLFDQGRRSIRTHRCDRGHQNRQRLCGGGGSLCGEPA
ncbi:response regulator transcription factor [Bradyrhizobium sp. S3.3.6]|uniref:response regulator n=1 Tax=Bradyrhizobium sp. S3.3.6 TaxID=3156429 RepID=UPI003392DEFC